MADAELLRRLRVEGGQAGEQLLLTGVPGQLHLGDDTRPPSPELIVNRPRVPTSCLVEPGRAAGSADAHAALLQRVREAQSDRWKRLQDALDAIQEQGESRSAVKVWPTVKEWMAAFLEAACNWPWVEDPNSARVIASAEDYEWCNGAIEAARREIWLPSGMTLPDVPPVLRIEEVQAGERFSEVWISPSMATQEVLRLVRHAGVGLHLVCGAEQEV